MGRMYSFHKTVRGYHHIINETSGEDASVSFSAEDGRYAIAVVADGHGSKACFRSEYGSKTATGVAFDCLKQFAEAKLASEDAEKKFYEDLFSDPRYCQTTLRQLTDTMIAEWYDHVMSHYRNNPPTGEEMGEYAQMYQNDGMAAHIYGTTLLAALLLPGCLMLFHQGDGRCEVFYQDGRIDQPIPWDFRCEDTAVTSMCDEDAAERFRTCVINITETPIAACYLGSDGVEDAYRDTYEGLGESHILMGGVHTFYKDLTCKLALMKREEFEAYLEPMLSEFSRVGRFSRSGSGDDVSVAGIVDTEAILCFVDKFQIDVKRYALEEDLFWKNDELRGKTRKHEILQKRMEKAQAMLESRREKQRALEETYQRLREEYNMFAVKTAQAKSYSSLSTGGLKTKAYYTSAYDRLLRCGERIRQLEEEMDENRGVICDLEQRVTDAKMTFSEYDAKYQMIEAEKRRIAEEVAALPHVDGKG